MNKQVRSFFEAMKARRANALKLEMALGNISIEIDEDDIEFIKEVRKKALEQGYPSSMLTKNMAASTVLTAKYALLHPDPINHFTTHWDEKKQEMQILMKDDSGVKVAGTVNQEMREQYMKSQQNKPAKVSESVTIKKEKKPKTFPPDIAPSYENDKKIAKWWMDENRNSIFNYEDPLDPLMPYFKIKSRNPLAIAFKTDPKGHKWQTVTNIPIDMDKFREKVGKEGFDPEIHAGALVAVSKQRWRKAVEDVKDEQGNIVPKKQENSNKITPGYFIDGEKTSKEFTEKFNDDVSFRRHVECICIQAVQKYYSGIKIHDRGMCKDGSSTEDIGYDISTTKTAYNVDSSTAEELLDAARMRLIRKSGFAKDFKWKDITEEQLKDPDSDVNNWLRREAATGVLNAKRDLFGKLKKEKTVGGTNDPEGAVSAGDLADNQQKSKGTFTDELPGDDGEKKPEGPGEKLVYDPKSIFDTDDDEPEDYQDQPVYSPSDYDDDAEKSVENMDSYDLLTYVTTNKEALKNPQSLQKVRQALDRVSRDPREDRNTIQRVRAFIDRATQGDPAKYQPHVPVAHEGTLPSFHEYLKWRTNESKVVWVKKQKPL